MVYVTYILLECVRFCMSNISRRSLLVICPQGEYRYLPSNIHICPRIQPPVFVQWFQKLYVKEKGNIVYKNMHNNHISIKLTHFKILDIKFK